MSTGLQIVSPKGYMGLKAGAPYMLLRNDPLLRRVVLVCFEDVDLSAKSPRSRKAHVKLLARSHYEAGLVPHREGAERAILAVKQPSTLPPWLSALEGTCFDADDKWTLKETREKTRVNSPLEEVERRIQIITPALKRVDEILSSDQPERVLNRIAQAGSERVSLQALVLRLHRVRPPMGAPATKNRLGPVGQTRCEVREL